VVKDITKAKIRKVLLTNTPVGKVQANLPIKLAAKVEWKSNQYQDQDQQEVEPPIQV